MRNLPTAVKNLLIINIIVFIGTEFIGNPMYEWFALFPVNSHFFHWWQFVTHILYLVFGGKIVHLVVVGLDADSLALRGNGFLGGLAVHRYDYFGFLCVLSHK